MLWAFVLLAPFSLIASDLPRGVAWPLAVFAAAWGMRDARRHARQPTRRFVIATGNAGATCDGAPAEGLGLAWRGPLAFLGWRDPAGRVRRVSFWPDTLDAAMRRELKLAVQRREAASDAASMAG